MANKPVYLLDSFALLAYLNGEPGGSRVQEVLNLAKSQDCRLVMSLINLGEVLYITERSRGLPMAQTVQALLESLPKEEGHQQADRHPLLLRQHFQAMQPSPGAPTNI